MGNKFFETNKAFLLSLLLLIFSGLAWGNRFIQDDAFISFRYAENFANGKGLVFNAGERVEGYTNFLWVLVESLIFKLGLPIVNSVHIVSIFFFIGSLLVVYRLSEKLLKNVSFSFFCVILVAVNPSFLAYGTGGLETQLQAFLVLISIYLYTSIYQEEEVKIVKLSLLGFVFTLLLLNRLDSGILILILSVALAGLHFYRKEKKIIKKLVVLYCFPAIVVGGWFLWKLQFYGNILPNTFYAKAVSGSFVFLVARGLFFVSLFAFLHFLIPIVLLVISRWNNIVKGGKWVLMPTPLTMMAVYVIIHLLYIIKVGGGFMEFRYFVQVIPLIYLLLIIHVTKITSKKLRIACLLLLFVNPIIGKLVMPNYIWGLESIENLSNHLYKENEDWIGIGKTLNSSFGEDSQVVIGVNPAGAIPFYSKFTSIDMLGLNDKWVALNGLPYRKTPGHFKIASYEYLQERGVDIVIGKPVLVRNTNLELERKNYSIAYLKKILPSMNIERTSVPQSILEIPISKNHTLVTWYLTENPDVGKVIARHGWNLVEVL